MQKGAETSPNLLRTFEYKSLFSKHFDTPTSCAWVGGGSTFVSGYVAPHLVLFDASNVRSGLRAGVGVRKRNVNVPG